MSAVERLQAAIDKLERQRHDSAGRGAHAWAAHSTTDKPSGHDAAIRGVGFPDDFFDGVADVYDPADAELIVTLHRTIDAQLAILRDGIARVHSWTDPDSQVGYEPHLDGPYPPGADATYLALADAILGGEL